MASTPIDIVNAALNILGAEVIQDFNEQNPLAISANLHYDRCRKGLLRDNPWTFSLKRATLATVSDANLPPVADDDFPYVYQLPADVLRIQRIENDGDYRKENNRILSKRDTCEILYVQDVEDVSKFDPKFEEALVAKLAYEMAYSVTRDNGMRAQNYSLFQEKVQEARFCNAIEDIEERIDIDNQRLIDVRFR